MNPSDPTGMGMGMPIQGMPMQGAPMQKLSSPYHRKKKASSGPKRHRTGLGRHGGHRGPRKSKKAKY